MRKKRRKKKRRPHAELGKDLLDIGRGTEVGPFVVHEPGEAGPPLPDRGIALVPGARNHSRRTEPQSEDAVSHGVSNAKDEAAREEGVGQDCRAWQGPCQPPFFLTLKKKGGEAVW